MDQSGQFHHILRKTLQFLLPVSLLSFLLSYSSALSYFFRYFNLHFSALLFSLSAHILERKYMFLICNGILAFLAKNSTFFRCGSPSESCSNGDSEKKDDNGTKLVPHELLETEALSEDEEVGRGSSIVSAEKVMHAEEDTEEKSYDRGIESGGALITKSEDEDEDVQEEVEGRCLIPTSSAEGNGVDLSTEELNRKFEEFIRKMKEEIRIEAQQQLIAV